MSLVSRLWVAVALLALTACVGAPAEGRQPLLVAAASDLQPAFTEIAEDYEQATGRPVTFTFGSSGQLAQQIVEGAPMDLFASANVAYVDEVVGAGRAEPDSRYTYAVGRIVVWSAGESDGWSDLFELADDAAVDTVAIANPAHAPYGQAAQEALTAVGVWERIQPRLVYGQNVLDAQRLAASGNADAAIVALSLALAADQGAGTWTLVPDDLHAPLRQQLVVTTTAQRGAAARDFVDHVRSDAGREVMRRFGLLLPGEDPPDLWRDPPGRTEGRPAQPGA